MNIVFFFSANSYNGRMETIQESEIRWGVIGVGDVCRVKSAPAMYKIPRSRLVAVMRRDGEKARAYASEHNVPHWYDDADKLLADPEVNAVYIATPPYAHLELTRKAAKAGKPVYVEKPMARSYHECREMITACEEAGVSLFVAYYRRKLPNYLKIKELVESGLIGEIRHVRILMNRRLLPEDDTDPDNWRVDPAIAGGGYFYDLASHQLDFLDYLMGPVTEAHGFSSNQAGLYQAEDLVTGTFRFENGVPGTGIWCFTTSRSSVVDQTVITGSKGEISYPTFKEYYVDLTIDNPENIDSGGIIDQAGKVSHAEKKGGSNPIRFRFEMPEHIQQPLIESVVQELLGEGRCPSTGITAARTNRVMEQLTE